MTSAIIGVPGMALESKIKVKMFKLLLYGL